MRGGIGLHKLIADYQFKSVLDIGCGEGKHSEIFRAKGYDVTSIDYGESYYFKQHKEPHNTIIADFASHRFEKQFDCVWCSHVLEHQLDTQAFLTKLHAVLKEGGVLAVTVPPRKDRIVGGHVSLWNAGLLLYRLVLAGFDCSQARILTYKNDLTVLLEKKTIPFPKNLAYDRGDIRKIRPALPPTLRYTPSNDGDDDWFDGHILRLRW